eukprot:Skav231424  [mRNA]  locus=scaffold330:109031:110044:+ [translate_table: standard]
MSNNYIDLFWALLRTGNFEKLKRTVPRDFNWKVLHPERRTTILVEALASCTWERKQAARELDGIEWLVKSGASYSQRSGDSNEVHTFACLDDEDEDDTEIPIAGQSALSFLLACLEDFWGDERNESLIEAAVRFTDRIAEASGQQTRPRAPVDEGIVDIWDKFLHATASHDLTIEALDGQVTAHAGMLQEASPVVRAMLVSPMKEAKTQRIQLADTTSDAVTLFLEALYTCSTHGDPDYKTALSALDLAHRWQVEAVVVVLSDLIQGLITEESFSSIAEHAVLKGLDTLKQACCKFGSQCTAVQRKIKKGQLPKVVQDLFQGVETSKTRPVKKRKHL